MESQLVGIRALAQGDVVEIAAAIRRAATVSGLASVCSVSTTLDGAQIANAAVSLPPSTAFVDLWIRRFRRALSDEYPSDEQPVVLAFGKITIDVATPSDWLVQATRNIRSARSTSAGLVQISRPTDSPLEQLLLFTPDRSPRAGLRAGEPPTGHRI